MVTVYVPVGAVLNTSNTNTTYLIEAAIPNYDINVLVDRGYMSSVGPYMGLNEDVPIPPGTYLPPYPVVVAVNITIAFCNQHWTNLSYDPTLEVIFTGPPDTPHTPPKSPLWVPAVATVVPVVAAVSVLTLVLIKVPKLRIMLLHGKSATRDPLKQLRSADALHKTSLPASAASPSTSPTQTSPTPSQEPTSANPKGTTWTASVKPAEP